MGCKLTQNIKHNCEYNPGGIIDVFLLDVNDFYHYQFENDGLYNSCYVEDIIKQGVAFIKLDVVSASAFTERQEGGVYKQELQTFVRSLNSAKTSQLLLTKANKYIVAYRTHDDKAFSFGMDGGASLVFTQQSGQVGDASGYQIIISKSSIYPQFEIDGDILKENLLSSEGYQLMVTEDGFYVEIERNKNGRN